MYKINTSENNIIELELCNFSDLKIKERDHLQEWIAKKPDVLGEELLIIQKEYAGFNDTNERLDLLALDKLGNVVVIENKLDDTGRDVVWQALKYVSYCSTLSTKQIIRIYQEYLDKSANDGDAKQLILDFLQWEDSDDDILLNQEDQRIILLANNYRKEVTSTVLWLIKHDVNVQCFKAVPYRLKESGDMFLQVQQIIPLPETKQFMIDAKEKEKEEQENSSVVIERKKRLKSFWSALKQNLIEHNNSFLDNVSAAPYYDLGTSRGNGRFAYCIGSDALRVELYFWSDEDMKYFNAMRLHQNEIESKLGRKLIWQPLDGRKGTRIKLETKEINNSPIKNGLSNPDNWDDWITWFRKNMELFYNVVYPYLEKVQQEIK